MALLAGCRPASSGLALVQSCAAALFTALYILFNLMWWWYLGGAVEKRLGSGKLFVIMLISALLSGWLQAKFSGIWFGGLSGVGYARRVTAGYAVSAIPTAASILNGD